MSNDFLTEDVDKLEKPSGYMKFEAGSNKFRPLDSMITGWIGWRTTPEGRRPIRVRAGDNIPLNSVDNPDEVKPFYAFPVWNYKYETIQILEIKQKGIQKTIKDLARNKDWGSPVGVDGYDITVTREGEGMDTEYTVSPSPHRPLDEGIMQTYRDMNIHLEALFDGEDPFAPRTEDIDMDEADKAISGS